MLDFHSFNLTHSSSLGVDALTPYVSNPKNYYLFSFIIVCACALRHLNHKVLDHEPPFLPYWIPWFGHVFDFAKDSNKVILSAKKYFGSMQPFTLKIAGNKYYIVNDPKDVAQVYKHTKELSFDSFAAVVIVKIYGIIDRSINGSPDVAQITEGGVFNDVKCENSHTFFRKHLSHASYLETLTNRSAIEIEQRLDEELAQLPAGGFEVSTLQWMRKIFSLALTDTVYGHNFLKRFPNIMDDIWIIDSAKHKFLYSYPRRYAEDAYAARANLISTLEAYQNPECDELRMEALEMIFDRNDFLAKAGVPNDMRASVQLAVFHALHTNAAPAAFWTLLYVLTTEGLAARILEETQPAFALPTSDERVAYISSPAKCPLLNSVWFETLRLTSSTVSSRLVEETVQIGGYTLYPGNKLFCPARPTQISTDLWGSDAAEFKPDRFVNNPEDLKATKMRPFGGGISMCPGRMFAANAVKWFVVGILRRFDVEVVGGKMCPVDDKTPNLGMMKPLGDPFIKIAMKL